MLLGVHISGVSNICEAPVKAYELGCNTMQIFVRSPQRWREGSLSAEAMAEFVRRRKKYKINPLFIHVSYLINLASPNPNLYKGSIEAYIEDILEADKLGADYIVTHMGSHKDTSEEAGLKRFSAAMNTILAQTRKSRVGVLLENTSGSGSWLGYKFSHQRAIIEAVKQKERLGLCFDTAHAYLAGNNIATAPGLEAMVKQIEQNVGTKHVKLMHLNDAAGKLGCRHDRHAHIGKGSIGLEGIKNIVNHPKLKNAAFILETPKETPQSDMINLDIVRKLRKDK